MTNPTRRAVIGGAVAGVVGPKPLLAATQTLNIKVVAPVSTGGAYITGESFGSTAAGNYQTNYQGMAITPGTNLAVTALGRWILSGNNLPHDLGIFDATTQLQIAGPVTLTPPFSGVGFLYVNLPSPVVLQSGHRYYIVSQEYQYYPVDQLYQPDSSYTHTADATLDGSVSRNGAFGGAWNFRSDGSSFGPTNFQYTTTAATGMLAGSPFIPVANAQQYGPGSWYPAQNVQVAGSSVGVPTVTLSVNPNTPQQAPYNTFVGQWMLDNQPIGPYILGPDRIYPDAGFQQNFRYNLDVTTLSEGTHSVWLKIIDSINPGTNQAKAAYWQVPIGGEIIVQNIGPKNGAQLVPIHTAYPDNSNRFLRPPADFVQYPGDPLRAVNTFPHPAPFAAPAYSTASPFNPGFSGYLDPRVAGNYYIEDTTKLPRMEYLGDVSFLSTPQAGVYCIHTQYGNFGNTTDEAWKRLLAAFEWDGGRYDTRVTAYAAFVADPDDSLTNPTGFIGTAVGGRIFRQGYDGSVETLFGLTLDRFNNLPYDPMLVINNLGSAGYALADLTARYRMVGSIALNGSGQPQFGQIGGTNASLPGMMDVAYDWRDATHNTIYYVNIIFHVVIKVTGLKTNPIATLFAGVEGTAGYQNGNVSGGNPGNVKFASPTSCIMDGSGNLYIADRDNCAIRQINVDTGAVTTLCGNQTGRPPPVVNQGGLISPPSLLQTYDETVLSKPQPGNTYGWSPSYAAFNGYISGTSLTVVGTVTGAMDGIQVGLPLDGPGVSSNTFITDKMDATHWTVNNSQTVGSSGSPVALQAGLIPTSAAYAVYPTCVRFSSTGDIIFLEWACNAIRRIRLSGANSGNVTRIGLPKTTYDNTINGFTWIDVDNPVYPVDYRGSSPTAGQGACGALDDIILIAFPEGLGNATSARLSIDGSYNAPFSSDGAGFVCQYGEPWLGVGEQFNYYATYMPEGPHSYVSDPFGVYTWVACFSKYQARLLTGGFRYWGLLTWRAQLPSDPTPSRDNSGASYGAQVYALGTTSMFPLGTRPSFALLHGIMGFGHLGSDVAPTFHDMAVVYNGGDAQWHLTNTDYPIASMTWNSGNGGQIVVVMSVATFVQQAGNFVFISGATNSGSLGNAAVNGKFRVISYIDSRNWTIAAPAASGQIGTIGGSPVISTGTGILAKYLAGGSHGLTPRPELDVPAGHNWYENNDTVALIYYILRHTTPGSLPVPTAPPTFYLSDLNHPQVTNLVATRLSLTSMQVTWTSDKLCMGLLIAGSPAQQTAQYPYTVWSQPEGGYTSSHSLVINQLPMSIPTHWSLMVRDWIGNTSYITDQTIGIHPDGTEITGGTGLTPNNTTKLVTNYGEWTFGAQMNTQPGYGGGAFFQVLLNGKVFHQNAFNTLTPAPNISGAQRLRVDHGGNLYAITHDQLWYVVDGYAFSSQTNGVDPPPSGHNPPSPIYQPFGPISADGTSITGTSGSLTTADGVWTFDGSGHANLNGIPLRDDQGGIYNSITVVQLQVNAHGQMFLKTSDGNWHLWANYQLNVGTTSTPPSGPVPIAMSFSPPNGPASGVTHSATTGTLVTTVSVTMSDGSAFTGALTVTQDDNNNTTLKVSGNQLQVQQPGWNASFGISSLVTVVATQNGFPMEGLFDGFHS